MTEQQSQIVQMIAEYLLESQAIPTTKREADRIARGMLTAAITEGLPFQPSSDYRVDSTQAKIAMEATMTNGEIADKLLTDEGDVKQTPTLLNISEGDVNETPDSVHVGGVDMNGLQEFIEYKVLKYGNDRQEGLDVSYKDVAADIMQVVLSARYGCDISVTTRLAATDCIDAERERAIHSKAVFKTVQTLVKSGSISDSAASFASATLTNPKEETDE